MVARGGSAAGDPSPATPIPWLTRGRGDLGARRQTTVRKERLLDHPGTPAKVAPGPGWGGRGKTWGHPCDLGAASNPRPAALPASPRGVRGGGAKQVRPEGRARFLTLSQDDSGSAGADGKVTEFISWRQPVPRDGQEMPDKAKGRQNPGLTRCGVRLNPGVGPGEEGPRDSPRSPQPCSSGAEQ